MTNKKILVVVCAYNEQDAIFNCLDSLKNSIARYSLDNNFSVVCVDNSSIDKTPEIASKFAKENKDFHYVKIEHCSLCVSRNTYKYFDGFDYVAYIDGDGYVAEGWAKKLVNIIDQNPEAKIISGHVFDLESKSHNLIWDMYFDSELYGVDNYLIGANMVFSRNVLTKVDGFPSFFPIRGDESSLLLRIRNLRQDVNHVFDKNLIAYNYFPSDLDTFLKTQYTDGKRSYDISQLSGTYRKTKLNAIVKTLSLVLLLSTPIITIVNPMLGLMSLLASIGPFACRHRIYIKNVFGKISKPNTLRKIKYVSVILLSRYLFDIGFLSRLFESQEVRKEMLDDTKNPVVLEKINE